MSVWFHVSIQVIHQLVIFCANLSPKHNTNPANDSLPHKPLNQVPKQWRNFSTYEAFNDATDLPRESSFNTELLKQCVKMLVLIRPGSKCDKLYKTYTHGRGSTSTWGGNHQVKTMRQSVEINSIFLQFVPLSLVTITKGN